MELRFLMLVQSPYWTTSTFFNLSGIRLSSKFLLRTIRIAIFWNFCHNFWIWKSRSLPILPTLQPVYSLMCYDGSKSRISLRLYNTKHRLELLIRCILFGRYWKNAATILQRAFSSANFMHNSLTKWSQLFHAISLFDHSITYDGLVDGYVISSKTASFE